VLTLVLLGCDPPAEKVTVTCNAVVGCDPVLVTTKVVVRPFESQVVLVAAIVICAAPDVTAAEAGYVTIPITGIVHAACAPTCSTVRRVTSERGSVSSTVMPIS
jgi:hypothetical protein